MAERDLIPMPGRAFVGMRNMFSDFEDGILIPKNAKSMTPMGRFGQVAAITPYPEGRNSWVFEHGHLESRPAWKQNEEYIKLLGEWVVCRNAKMIWGQLYEVRLEFIETIVPEEARPEDDAVGRCKRCRSTGEANILLGPDGFCPVCGFNKYDVHITTVATFVQTPDGAIPIVVDEVSESEIDQYVRKPAEIEHFLRTGGKAVTGRVYSFPGQKHHGTVDQAVTEELSDFMKHWGGK